MSRFSLLFLIVSVSLCAQSTNSPRANDRGSDLVEVLAADARFSTLVQLAGTAGLVETLTTAGPLTLFAPTNEAFARLDEKTVSFLTSREGRADLSSILRHHLVTSRVTAIEAVVAGTLRTAQGTDLSVVVQGGQLRVSGARVLENDREAGVAIIHVLDSVLLPPGLPRTPARRASGILELAVSRGAPLFNAGDIAGCAAVYEVAARALTDLGGELPIEARRALESALKTLDKADARRSAWTLRSAIDEAYAALSPTLRPETEHASVTKDNEVTASLPEQLAAVIKLEPRQRLQSLSRLVANAPMPSRAVRRLARGVAERQSASDAARADERLLALLRTVYADMTFQPEREAAVPKDWPAPTKVGEIEVKTFPSYRMARADMGKRQSGMGTLSFWKLFSHIKSNDIAMTAPVQMDYPASDKDSATMAFLYSDQALGQPGTDGDVNVVDIPAMTAASIGIRGELTDEALEEARSALSAWLGNQETWQAVGGFRTMGWNGPSTPSSRRFWEVQIPIVPAR